MGKVIYMSFLTISAIVFGAFFGGMIGNTPGLSWLGYSKTFAFEPGTLLNFDILRLTFGISFSINISQILLIIIAIIVFYKTAPKLFPPKG